ncbi:MAG TPA: PAS domain S-box protein [Candidatus Binataceae bacterium]|nr:PAS domain S-box protein [Candidatus Binataceae bacterium]
MTKLDDLSGSPVTGSENRLALPYEGPGRELTDERRREYTTALLQTIADVSEAAIVSCDSALRFTSWNQSAERIFGYTAQEAIGQPIALLAPPRLIDKLNELDSWLYHGESVRDVATQGLRKDGSVFDALMTAVPIVAAGGATLGVSFIVRDISEERAARGKPKETERWLREALAHAPLMVSATDHNGVYTMLEGQALTALGIQGGEALVGRSALEFMGTGSLIAESTRKALAGETTTTMALINGHSFEMWKAPLRDARGRITGTLSVNTDVSRRVAAEEELKARLRQQETIAAISKSALGGTPFADLAQSTAERVREALDIDLAGVFVGGDTEADFKPQALVAAEAIGEDLADLKVAPYASLAAAAATAGEPVISENLAAETRFIPHPEIVQRGFASAMAAAFGSLNEYHGVLLVYSRDRRRFSRDDANFIEAVANILTSAIANSEAQQKLQRSEAYFRRVIEHTSDVLVVIDQCGLIRFIGGAYESLLGLPAEALIGTPTIDYVEPEWRDAITEATKRAFRHPGEVTRVEYCVRGADDSWLSCESIMKAVTDLGDETMLVVSVRDISARKHQEVAIAQARDLALESARLKSAFLANMSHEVRTPVNIIMGYSDLVAEYLEENGDNSQKEFLAAITRAGQRLLRTIDGVLDFSKLSSGSLTVAPQMLKLEPLIERQLREVEADATVKNLTIECGYEAGQAEVWCDEYCLGHAILNLLENAIKFTNQGGLKIRVYQGAGGELCLDVGDTGIGIDPAFLPRLLEPFAQEDTSVTRRFEGAGLGLAVAKGYLECNGARLTATSDKGVGSVFTITFPRVVDCGRDEEHHSLMKAPRAA